MAGASSAVLHAGLLSPLYHTLSSDIFVIRPERTQDSQNHMEPIQDSQNHMHVQLVSAAYSE